MADYESVRQRIIDSVFSRRNAAGHHETYAGHLKIWEDAPEGGDRKPRYVLLSRMSHSVKHFQGYSQVSLCSLQRPALAMVSFTNRN